MGALLQILIPLRYLAITRWPKFVVDVVLPLLFGCATTFAIASQPMPFNIAGPNGLISGVNSALQVLVGFYVAALVGVSTFSSESLDQPLADGMRVPGKNSSGVASRRELLCYLFGYLSLLGFALLLAGLFAIPFRFALFALLGHPAFAAARIVCAGVYICAVWGLFFSTALGLYYLVDRIHRADPTPLTGAGVMQLAPTPQSKSGPVNRKIG